jgi:hypothetical protein
MLPPEVPLATLPPPVLPLIALPPIAVPPIATPPPALAPLVPREVDDEEETVAALPPAEMFPPCACVDEVLPALPELLVQPKNRPKTASKTCVWLFI